MRPEDLTRVGSLVLRERDSSATNANNEGFLYCEGSCRQLGGDWRGIGGWWLALTGDGRGLIPRLGLGARLGGGLKPGDWKLGWRLMD
jgi:hypothetical protein